MPGAMQHHGCSVLLTYRPTCVVSLVLFVCMLLGLLVFPAVLYAQVGANEEPAVPNELLVGLKGGVPHERRQAMHAAVGARLVDEFPQINVHLLRIPAGARRAMIRALSEHPDVKFVEPNSLARGGYLPNDPSYPSQWHLPRIAAPSGWDISQGSTNVVVAVLDSGVDPSHPDLASKLLQGYNFLNGTTDVRDTRGHGSERDGGCPDGQSDGGRWSGSAQSCAAPGGAGRQQLCQLCQHCCGHDVCRRPWGQSDQHQYWGQQLFLDLAERRELRLE